MQRDQIEARVREILGHYRVNQKFIRGAGKANYAYAVYAGKNLGRTTPNPDVKQVSEDLTSGEAKALAKELTVADLVTFIESIKESNQGAPTEG
jgi:hypothetical protein